jgi:hypothetical protein
VPWWHIRRTRVRTSQTTPIALPLFWALISATFSVSTCSFTSHKTTFPPRAAKFSAKSRPIPDAAPVDIATVFLKFIVYILQNYFIKLYHKYYEEQSVF